MEEGSRKEKRCSSTIGSLFVDQQRLPSQQHVMSHSHSVPAAEYPKSANSLGRSAAAEENPVPESIDALGGLAGGGWAQVRTKLADSSLEQLVAECLGPALVGSRGRWPPFRCRRRWRPGPDNSLHSWWRRSWAQKRPDGAGATPHSGLVDTVSNFLAGRVSWLVR